MKTVTKKLRKATKTILFFVVMFSATKQYAQIYANVQTNGANGICIGCGVVNPQNAVDGNTNTYSTAKLTVAVLGANLYQNLKFPIVGNAGEYVGLAIQDSLLGLLDATSLSGMQLTTYSNNASNNDTKNSTQFTISQLTGSVYLVQFMAGAPFDAVQLQINAGIVGSVSNVSVYYAYHSSTPLPISLLSFNAALASNQVKLNWVTATETNNSYFTIERSTDAENFYEIGKVKGAGNSTKTLSYLFTDMAPLAGVAYYRLKQTDYNGKFEYFKIVSVNNTANNTHVVVYPNPAKANAAAINITTTTDALVTVVNSTGTIIYTNTILQQANQYNYQVNLPQPLGAGVYSVIVTSATETSTHKLLVVND